MRVVVGLGGNALLRRGEPADVATQRRNVDVAVAAIAAIAREHDVVVTHGNGPQVGLLALQAAAYTALDPYPLDVLGAESEGMIGYLLDQALANALPGRQVATLLTQVIVAEDDHAFAHPTKPIGPVYAEPEARRLVLERGWTVGKDGGAYRRVVPSPEPQSIVEIEAIRLLVEHGVLVVCGGGGGIPVALGRDGSLRGVEAVIDKDRATSLLARLVGAAALLLLTDVRAVFDGWGTSRATELREITPRDLRRLHLDEGSMGPKVEAACRFVAETGGFAGIGALEDGAAVLAGMAGTRIVRD